jgi:ubiquitin-conjugating enzyme E2 Q
MPRKDFQRHLLDAQSSPLLRHVANVQPEEDDGCFSVFSNTPGITLPIKIDVRASDVGDYPKSHQFFITSDSNNLPPTLLSSLADISMVDGLTVSEVIKAISEKLISTTTPGSQHSAHQGPDIEINSDTEEGFGSNESDTGFGTDNEDYDNEFSSSLAFATSRPLHGKMNTDEAKSKAFEKKVRTDLAILKRSGFRIAHYGHILIPENSCYLLISCRVAKLEIPEDALKAWKLEREEYIMLLIYYHHGYKSIDRLKSSISSKYDITLRIGVTQKHKIPFSEVFELFATFERTGSGTSQNNAEGINSTFAQKSVRPLFIGSAMNELLNGRLITLIRYRLERGFSWEGSMMFFNNNQSYFGTNAIEHDAEYHNAQKLVISDELPRILRPDHLNQILGDISECSFPYVAMQFTLRYLVRCTEYCLVCYNQLNAEYKALKPYVCSNPLCLYQYMSLGFGPSLEFEVMTQEHVVDLLISFCYASSLGMALRQFPDGMGIMVPDPQAMESPISNNLPGNASRLGSVSNKQLSASFHVSKAEMARHSTNIPRLSAKWDKVASELYLNDSPGAESPRPGDWICFIGVGLRRQHCKVVEVWDSKLKHSVPIEAIEHLNEDAKRNLEKPKSEMTKNYQAFPLVWITRYNRLYDDLSIEEKNKVVTAMLKTLPSVNEMKQYLSGSSKQHPTLQSWTERFIPAAFSIFRWIISSNRSCIVRVNSSLESDDSDEGLVVGMPGYMQFRFVSGAPDKESRFVKAVKTTAHRSMSKIPTIFAWHGSSLSNWHSIVRDGLNYDKVTNGRAYGNGVYHALDATSSLGYSGRLLYTSRQSGWPSSVLGLEHAVCLNEIVNAPKEFVSSNPYLVVNNLDWIQTRYLFVKVSHESIDLPVPMRPQLVLEQDPWWVPEDIGKSKLIIPMSAISKSRWPDFKTQDYITKYNTKKQKIIATKDEDDGDAVLFSEASEEEDVNIYLSATKHDACNGKSATKNWNSVTDFIPGTLDRSNLPILAPPQYATSSASRTLQRELKAMLKEQEETPFQELGWYIDPEHIDNPYQWIIELHSFDSNLPLAVDMKNRGINSVVLELRFGPSYNFSPPFIRVIKPRFLPFLLGGGGHVTAGGALCMELLTNNGWNPSATLQAVLLQVRLALTSTDPTPARLDPNTTTDYRIGEAIEAYQRACRTHGVGVFVYLFTFFALLCNN